MKNLVTMVLVMTLSFDCIDQIDRWSVLARYRAATTVVACIA